MAQVVKSFLLEDKNLFILHSEWVSQWLSLTAFFGDNGHRGPCSPYKLCNHILYICCMSWRCKELGPQQLRYWPSSPRIFRLQLQIISVNPHQNKDDGNKEEHNFKCSWYIWILTEFIMAQAITKTNDDPVFLTHDQLEMLVWTIHFAQHLSSMLPYFSQHWFK